MQVCHFYLSFFILGGGPGGQHRHVSGRLRAAPGGAGRRLVVVVVGVAVVAVVAAAAAGLM